MHPLLHALFRIALGAAAIGLISLGVDIIRRTRQMQRTGNVRNLLGLRPWYNYFITDERMRQSAISAPQFLGGGIRNIGRHRGRPGIAPRLDRPEFGFINAGRLRQRRNPLPYFLLFFAAIGLLLLWASGALNRAAISSRAEWAP